MGVPASLTIQFWGTGIRGAGVESSLALLLYITLHTEDWR
jgi:hypothetical protein